MPPPRSQLMNETVVREAEQMSEHLQRLQKDYQAALLNIDQLTQRGRETAQKLKVLGWGRKYIPAHSLAVFGS